MNKKDIFVGNIVYYPHWLHATIEDYQKHVAEINNYYYTFMANNNATPDGYYIRCMAMCLISNVNEDGTVTLANCEGGGYIGIQPSEIYQTEAQAKKSYKLKDLKAGIAPIYPWGDDEEEE
jgi:hypothetical protein